MQRPYRSAQLLGLGLVLLATQALGHTTLAGTSPQDGAVLSQSPPLVEMRFRAPVSLTSVTVLDAGTAQRKLDFAPKGSATLFKLPGPALAAGRNRLQWKALSQDGHVITGSFSIEIRPVATNAH